MNLFNVRWKVFGKSQFEMVYCVTRKEKKSNSIHRINRLAILYLINERVKTYIECIRILCGFKMTNKILFNIHELNSFENLFFFHSKKIQQNY